MDDATLSIDRNRKLKESESEDDDNDEDDDDEDSALSRVVIPAPRSEVVDAEVFEDPGEDNDTNGWYLIDRANSWRTTC